MRIWQILGFASFLFCSQSASASEEELRAEIEKLKTIVAAQQAEIIAIRSAGQTNLGGNPTNPGNPTTPGTGENGIDEPKVKAWCDNVNREIEGCVACARQHGFDSVPFKACVKVLPKIRP